MDCMRALMDTNVPTALFFLRAFLLHTHALTYGAFALTMCSTSPPTKACNNSGSGGLSEPSLLFLTYVWGGMRHDFLPP